MARKINKKTRNVISGLLVGAASIYAVINFADIPAQEVRSFFLSTAIFIAIIVVLAFIAVSLFKLLLWLKELLVNSLSTQKTESDSTGSSGADLQKPQETSASEERE